MGFKEVMEKIGEFFEDPGPEPVTGDPIEYKGVVYTPFQGQEKSDEYPAWPNAVCPCCKGVQLKPKMYFNKENQTFYHKECLLKPEEECNKKKFFFF